MTTKIPVELSSTPSIVDNGDATAITIDSSERVGIGTTSPGTILHTRTSDATSNNNAGGGFYHVSSSTAGSRIASVFLDADNGNFSTSSDGAYAYIEKIGGGGNLNIRNQDSSPIAFFRSSSESMRIDSSGSLLIGSSTSIASNIGLQVTGTNAAGFISLFRDDSSVVANDDLGGILFYGDDNNATTQFASIRATAEGTHADGDNPTALRFLTTSDGAEVSAERMKITSGGMVYMNGSTGSFGTPSFTDGILFTYKDDNEPHVENKVNHANTMGLYKFQNSNGTAGSISMYSSSVTFNTSSDYRLKEDVNYTWDAISKLKELKPCEFKFKADSDDVIHQGFLAHEVDDIVPTSVFGEKDGTEMQQIDHSKLVPLLTKAIQEQQAIIEDLQTQINEVKNGN